MCTLKGNNAYSLAEQIMNNLLGRQVDNNYVVRMYCIRGLGNMADIGENKVCLKYVQLVALIAFLGFSIFNNNIECHVGRDG